MNICNHAYTAGYLNRPRSIGRQCPYPQFFDRIRSTDTPLSETHAGLALPVDVNGICIFHSQELEWKRQNDFTGKFFELVHLLDKHDAERYYDFAEFVFTGSDRVTIRGAEEYLLRITDTSFRKQAYFTAASFLDSVELERVNFQDGASFDQAIFHHDLAFEQTRIRGLDCTKAKFTDGVSFQGTQFLSYALFSKAAFQGTRDDPLVIFKDSTFEGITDFSDSDFSLGDQSAVCFKNVHFQDCLDFRNTHFNCQVEFSDVSFADMTDFIDTSFDMVSSTARFRGTAVEFNRIQVTTKAVLSFISSDAHNKMFNHDVQMSFKEDPSGTVRFENVNFNRFTQSSKERLTQLAKSGKVEIGSGCIKDRFQTDVQTIYINQGNATLILEICQTFTNYFTLTSGLSLGFEIVERNKSKISFFYFTDDDISEETFRIRLAQTEEGLWGLLSIGSEEQLAVLERPSDMALPPSEVSDVIAVVDVLSALLGTFFRVGVRISLGAWVEADTRALLSAIQFNQHTAEHHLLTIPFNQEGAEDRTNTAPVFQEGVQHRAASLHSQLAEKYTRTTLFDLSRFLNSRLFLEGQAPVLSQTVKLLADKGDNYFKEGDYEVNSQRVVRYTFGPNANPRDTTLNQFVNQIQERAKMSQLADELSRLRQAMSQEATAPEQYIAIGEVAKAEQAAYAKDSIKVLQFLRSAGGWALDVAKKIGVSLASDAIQHSIGAS